MNCFRNIITIFVLIMAVPLSVSRADNLLTIHDENSSQWDVGRIQRIVLRMVMGIQHQNPYRVYMHYRPDPDKPAKTDVTELEDFKKTLDALFGSFSSRTVAKKPSEVLHNSFDFIDMKKDLYFSKDGNEAWLDVELGFYSLPGDQSVLSELPVEKLNVMTESEKEMQSRFRTTRLSFKKIEGDWYLTSLKELDKALQKLTAHYQVLESNPAVKAKK